VPRQKLETESSEAVSYRFVFSHTVFPFLCIVFSKNNHYDDAENSLHVLEKQLNENKISINDRVSTLLCLKKILDIYTACFFINQLLALVSYVTSFSCAPSYKMYTTAAFELLIYTIL